MSIIDDIKAKLDIVDVVSQYVTLKKAGRNFTALCPFHTEKSASFFVFPDRQSWHCFGACGSGGDVFSFVMKKEGIEFGDALRLLAERTGVSLAQKRGDSTEDKEVSRLRELCGAAAQYYHHLLLNAKEAERASAYVMERGLERKIVEEFQIGFSLDSWDAIYQHLAARGYTRQEMIAAGLQIERDDGSYDRFRNRMMFPIRDIDGRVVGFGARALDDSTPKYLNSPQTPVFDKSGILYGLDRARTAIHRHGSVVIVEGYMDVLMAHQNSFDNVVASMGTALTEKQIGYLKRLTKNFIMAMDADEAGQAATLRELEMTWGAVHSSTASRRGARKVPDSVVSVVVMPKNKDADDVIRESPQRWQELVNSAKRWEDFVFDTVIDSLDLETVEGKTEARNRLLPYIDAMPDPVRQSHYLQKLSRLIQVDERTLKAWVRSLRIGRGGRRLKDVSETSFDIPMASPRDPLEEYCLYLLLSYPELGDKAAALLPHHFERVENRAIFEVVHGDWNVESLPQRIDASLQEHLDSLLGANWPPVKEEVRESALTDCIRRLEERRLKGMKRQEALMWQEGSRQDLPHIEELSYHMWCSGDADVEGVDGDLLHLAELHRKGIEVNQQLKRIHASERSKTRLRRIETNSEKRANP